MSFKRITTDSMHYGSYFFVVSVALIIFSMPMPGFSDAGMDSSRNILAWMAVAVLSLYHVKYLGRQTKVGNTILPYLSLAVIFLCIPLCWSQDPFRAEVMNRLFAIVTLVTFLLLLLQHPLRGGQRHAVYSLVILAGLVQLLLALWQILCPNKAGILLGYNFALAEGRPIGTLMQVNLLGSFLATSLLCSLWFVAFARHPWVRKGAGFAVLAFALGIAITQSRTALLGALCGSLVICIAKREWGFALMVALMLSFGMVAGNSILTLRPQQLSAPAASATHSFKGDQRPIDTQERFKWDRQHSNNERQALLKGSLEMISTRVLKGYGLGSFERQFPHALADIHIKTPFTVTVRHPHNELLYVWSEGGVIAAIGLIILFIVLSMPLLYWCSARVVARGALLIPIMVHTLTEYPLYLSVTHGALLIILLWLAFPVRWRKTVKRKKNNKSISHCFLASTISLACIVGFIYMLTGLRALVILASVEEERFIHPEKLDAIVNPFAQSERIKFDYAIANLVKYNVSNKYSALNMFHRLAGNWLLYHNDANLIATMIQIDSFYNRQEDVYLWRKRGCASFASDPRFGCSSTFLSTGL